MTQKVEGSGRYKNEVGEFRIETSGPLIFICFDCGGEAAIQKPMQPEEAKAIAVALTEAANWLIDMDKK